MPTNTLIWIVDGALFVGLMYFVRRAAFAIGNKEEFKRVRPPWLDPKSIGLLWLWEGEKQSAFFEAYKKYSGTEISFKDALEKFEFKGHTFFLLPQGLVVGLEGRFIRVYRRILQEEIP